MTRHDRRAYWEQQLSAWDATELSAAGFCHQHSLSYHKFLYWRRQRSASGASSSIQAAVGFARVKPIDAAASAQLAVTLPTGVQIAGLHAGNVHLLGEVLAQL